MAASIGKWAAQASLDVGGFTRGTDGMIKSAERARAGMKQPFRGMENDLESFMGRLSASVNGPMGMRFGFGNIFAALGVASFSEGIQKMQKIAEEELDLGFFNDQLGTSIEWLSAFRTVANETNLTTEQWRTSLGRLQQTIGNAAGGAAEARDTFRQLGLDWRSIRDMGFDDSMFSVADALSRIDNRAQRARLSVELFGREGGQRMLRLMEQGGEGLRAAIADAQARGGFLTDVDLQRFRDMDDAMDRMATGWRNMWREMAVAASGAAPAIEGVLETIADGIRHVHGLTTPAQDAALRRLQEVTLQNERARVRRFRETGDERFLMPDFQGFAPDGNDASFPLAQRTYWDSQGQRQTPLDADRIEADARQEFWAEQQRRFNADVYGEAGEAGQAFQNRVDALGRQMAEAAEATGLSGNQLSVYRMRQEAATAAQHRAVNALQEQADALDRLQLAQRQNEHAMDRVRQMAEQTRSPLENFEREMRRIRQSGLDTTQQAALTRAAFDRLASTIPERQLPRGFEAGSTEAVSLINQNAIQTQSAMDRVREVLATSQAIQAATREYNREIRDALRRLAGEAEGERQFVMQN